MESEVDFNSKLYKQSLNYFNCNTKSNTNSFTISPAKLMELIGSAYKIPIAKKLENIIAQISSKIFEGYVFPSEWAMPFKSLMLYYHKLYPHDKLIYVLSISNFVTICDRNGLREIEEQVVNIDKLFSNAEIILEEVNNKNSQQFIETKVKLLVNRALYLRHNERFEESNNDYEQLLIAAKHANNSVVNKLGWFYALTGLADILDRKGKYSDALNKYKEAEEVLRDAPDQIKDPLLPCLWEKQGNELYHLKYYKEAEINYLNALKARQKKFKKDNIYTSNVYHNLGILYKEIGQFNDKTEQCLSGAFSCLKKALQIRKKYLNKNHPHIAITLKHLGDSYLETGQCRSAITHYKKAIEIRKKTKNLRESIYMANLLNSLAVAYLFDNEQGEAAAKFVEASRVFNSFTNINLSTNQRFYTEFLRILNTKLNY
ncbi:tetratricopeptide repeat protein [Candidatus Jidaibacter acanthamoebae]|nr:tetratricopeptide repeat protein [Candidatus Jidaibacter acanthamoeba]